MMMPLLFLMTSGIRDNLDSLLEQLRSEKIEERADAEEKLARLSKTRTRTEDDDESQ
jgi:hypothetical protein